MPQLLEGLGDANRHTTAVLKKLRARSSKVKTQLTRYES